MRHGHYPEGRSDAKGTEPVGSERGGFIAVYALDAFGHPRFEQLLPAPLEPEGLLVIPQRNLLVASGEADLEGLNVRSTVSAAAAWVCQTPIAPPSSRRIQAADKSCLLATVSMRACRTQNR